VTNNSEDIKDVYCRCWLL